MSGSHRWLFAALPALLMLGHVESRANVYALSRPWQRYPSRSSAGEPQGRNHPPSQSYAAERDHFLDDDDWMTDKRVRSWDPFPKKSVNKYSLTSKLIFANVAAFAAQSFNPSITRWGIKLSDRILRGQQLYRLITPVFLHGSIFHLFTNMYSLQNVGNTSERMFGSGRFLALYLASGLAGNVLSAFMSPNPALGASGAVFGVMTGFTVFLSRHDWLLGNQGKAYSDAVTQTLLINLVLGAISPMIDNWGHAGGALGGAVMAYYFGPRLFLVDMPWGRRAVVDMPILRLPRSVEKIPSDVGITVASVMKRLRPGQYFPTNDKPWMQRPSRPNYSQRRANTDARSIKPKYEED